MNRFWQRPALLMFLAWLLLFYAAWLALVLNRDLLGTALAHWPMAVAMAVGSYVAGSTPMGGGTVGFPVLVLLMDLPASLGRDFSFAVQSVGMTSASIYILCSGKELEWPMLRAAMLGALVVSRIGRRPTLVVVSVLCVIQFIWTLVHEREQLSVLYLGLSLLAVALFLLIFQDMYRHGYRLARRGRSQPSSVAPD